MRIKVIDGFRTIAVLGVLWAHIWMFAGTPSYKVIGVDIARLISFFGTGVDLFFVISGFCMYLMYVSKKTSFNSSTYFGYLKKRWLRIAPAFYAAILMYGLFAVSFQIFRFDAWYAIKNAMFIKTFFTAPTQYAPHFWSLCTEWHFYLVLPFIVWGIHFFPFYRFVIFLLFACLIFRFFVWIPNNDPHNIINYSIPNRLIEFLMGIIAAKLFLDKKKGWIFSSVKGILIGVVIAFAGRLMMTEVMQEHTGYIGIWARTFNLPLLSFGYALALLNTLQTKTWFSALMESRLFNRIGKYSYSMYLWHWIIAEWLTIYLMKQWKTEPFLLVNMAFLIAVFILYPISAASYRIFESFYFSRRTSKQHPISP
jgi:peptidoglycan/LPS O-acetylase OafA/YrhL